MILPGRGLRARLGTLAVAGMALAAGEARGQGLADYDYENLSFRGLGVEVGYLFPDRTESTASLGIRADLGYLGPGFRIAPGLTYWSARLDRDEVGRLEEDVRRLILRQPGQPAPSVDLGTIHWTNVVVSLDGQAVWRVPYGMLTYLGAGVSAHFLDGHGERIDDTFVEDVLDRVSAGLNVHAGVEYPVADRVRVYGSTRYEILSDLRYLEIRAGGKVMFRGSRLEWEGRE